MFFYEVEGHMLKLSSFGRGKTIRHKKSLTSFLHAALHLELAFFREDFSSVASVNVRFSCVFYFVFICSGYKLNSPHYVMGGRTWPVFIGGFPDFPKSRYSSQMLVCWIQWGRERRKRFVTVVAWKFLKISCSWIKFAWGGSWCGSVEPP